MTRRVDAQVLVSQRATQSLSLIKMNVHMAITPLDADGHLTPRWAERFTAFEDGVHAAMAAKLQEAQLTGRNELISTPAVGNAIIAQGEKHLFDAVGKPATMVLRARGLTDRWMVKRIHLQGENVAVQAIAAAAEMLTEALSTAAAAAEERVENPLAKMAAALQGQQASLMQALTAAQTRQAPTAGGPQKRDRDGAPSGNWCEGTKWCRFWADSARGGNTTFRCMPKYNCTHAPCGAGTTQPSDAVCQHFRK